MFSIYKHVYENIFQLHIYMVLNLDSAGCLMWLDMSDSRRAPHMDIKLSEFYAWLGFYTNF